MQTAQDSFFYHSNSRLGAGGGLENERQLLVEEQKLCRARARKFSLETIRRRKALEERRRQWDAQEQRLRETILQQRRQRVQSATERFQRAHLPPSQRHRQGFRRNVPNVEDALNQIQGAFHSYSRQSSFLSSTSNVSRSCTPSPKPPAVSKPSHRRALSAVEAYTKLLQEQSVTCLRSAQPEKQRDHSPQGSYLSDCFNSESLSSKDSLENEDPNQSAKNLQSSLSSFFLDSEEPILDGDNLRRSREEHKQTNQEDSEGPGSKMHFSNASWGFTSVEQPPDAETKPALHDCNRLTLCEITSAHPERFERKSPRNSPNDSTAAANRAAPGIADLQSSCPKQEALSDVRQQKVHDDGQLKHPSETEILPAAKNGNRKDILFGTSPKPNIFLDDSTTDNASQEEGTLQQTGKQNHNLSALKETNASINNLNKVSKPNTDNPINTVSLQHTCLSNIQKMKCLECPEEEEEEKVPVSVGISHSVCQVRFIKGILKKQSKYMSGDTARMYGAGHLIFAQEVALAIRDSVELTRTKTSDVQGNNGVKKKLRWFDEVGKDREQKQMKGASSSISLSNGDSEDHQLSLTAVSGASKSGPGATPPASAGYHFTKQAWADVGVQVSLPQQRADEVKVPWSATRPGGPKVPWRERPARAGAGPVSSRPRKGTVIRPQSATEVSQIAKAQGKIMAPRPPPRTEAVEEKAPYVTKAPYGASVNCKQTLAAEEAAHKNNSEGFFSPYAHHVIRTDSTVVYTPLPPSCTCPISEGNAKGTPSSGHQETQGSSRRRGTAHSEKGLCSERTPTEEDISQLWHGVRSALATKEAKTVLRTQAPETGRPVRKPFVEASRQPPGSGNRRFPPQPSQQAKQTVDPVTLFPTTYDSAFPDEGLESVTRLHLAEIDAKGLLEERDVAAAVETQRPATVQQRGQQPGLTTISLEEQKILLSLDRLNHQLYCVREHMGGFTGKRGLVLIDAASSREVKVTNHQKQRASSANNRPRHQRKF